MQEHMLKTLATEALKPASSIVDALLGPKIENIRKFAKKRDLLTKLEDKTVNDLLENYFKHLLRRVSEIKTLVFPEQVLPLTSIYEPLQLTNAVTKFNANRIDEEELDDNSVIKFTAEAVELGKNYLIVDSAGMGKSTFSKYFVLDIFQSTIKMPIFLELRRINESESLLHKLATDIDEHLEYINEDLLEMLLEQGGYIIILDGYDELSESMQKYIGAQITKLATKYEQNTIILTSRPEVSLPDVPNSIGFKIRRLTKEQAQSLILRYDSVADLSVGKDLIKELDTVTPEFLETPLLVVLLYQTYGHNHSIATKVTTFYDDVFNALYKGHDLSKAGFARQKMSQLDSVDFRRLLRGFAFLLTAQQKTNIKSRTEAYDAIEKAAALTSTKLVSASAFLDDLLLAVPLMIKDGNEFRFIHKSIGDFFSGEYLAFAANSEELIRGIQSSNLSQSFTKAIDFLADLNPSLFRICVVAPIAKAFLEKKSISNPMIRTICFLGKVEIGLFTQFSKKFETLITEEKFDSFSIHGTNGSTTIAIRRNNKIRIPAEAWNLLTKPLKDDLKLSKPMNEKKLLAFFKIDKWYLVNNQFSRKISGSPEIKALLLRIIFTISNNKEQKSELRILDSNLCKEALATIEREKKSQSWINVLIKNG